MSNPAPLESGALLAERFRLRGVLGRGGFGIAYLADDLERGERAVVKELAPSGSFRLDGGVMQIDASGRLVQRFLDEARTVAKLNIHGIPAVRSWFAENGTAYFASNHIDGAVSLEAMLEKHGRLSPNAALDLLYPLMETIEAIHHKGYLHRDIKPSNILVAPNGEVSLIDFGAAREWHATFTVHHTVLFTPGYSPIEQLGRKGRRGPATDIYALCATAYHMLVGEPPPDAADRLEHDSPITIRSLGPDVDLGLAAALEAGLRIRYEDRPQSVAELRKLLEQAPIVGASPTLQQLDEKLLAIRNFSFDKRACPSCGGLLESPRPLKRGVCPVCRRGTIRVHRLSERLCPICRVAALRSKKNDVPLAWCPLCKTGELDWRRLSVFGGHRSAKCRQCAAKYQTHEAGMKGDGDYRSWEAWRLSSGRSKIAFKCDGCDAQFDEMKDGRRKLVHPAPKSGVPSYYPEQWARIAARLEPDAGDAECDECGADFEVDGQRMSLLSTREDPFGNASRMMGRLLTSHDASWLGVGKESPVPGWVCAECSTEFDQDAGFLRLVRTEDRRLIRHVEEPKTLEDWHRVAAGLPEIHQEDAFDREVDDAIVIAYETGEIGFGSRKDLIWQGSATTLADGHVATLTVTDKEIAFGGMLRKWRTPLDAVVRAEAGVSHPQPNLEDGSILTLWLSGQREPMEWAVQPVELTAHLSSGHRSVELQAVSLACRIMSELK